MNYFVDLTDEELKYICKVIPFQETAAYFTKYPKEFGKLKPGFRVKSLTKNDVDKILFDCRNRDFIASFLRKHIDRWIIEIDEELEKNNTNKENKIKTYIEVLAQSFFAENAALYFKIKEEDHSDEFLHVMGAAVSVQSGLLQKSAGDLDLVEKEKQNLKEIQIEMEKKISIDERKTEKQRQSEEELKANLEKERTSLIEAENNNRLLVSKVSDLEEELSKVKENNNKIIRDLRGKNDSLNNAVTELKVCNEDYATKISEYDNIVSSLKDEIDGWKNQLRNREQQIFKYKEDIATFTADKDEDKRKIKELIEALEEKSVDKIESVEISTKATSDTNTDNEAGENKKVGLYNVDYTIDSGLQRMPLCPENMDDFEEYFIYNLENIGFLESAEGSIEFVNYLKSSLFTGTPLLIKRAPGINLANCLANTIAGVSKAPRLSYSKGMDAEDVRGFLCDTSCRIVCIDGFLGNINEMELVPIIEQHRDKIVFITYMYDKTLNYIPHEILAYCNYISADVFSEFLRIKDVTEDPSEIKEKEYVRISKVDTRIKRIFCEIAMECGISRDTALSLAELIEDEDHMVGMLIFTLLPYVLHVKGENPYNLSRRLQKYAGPSGNCLKKELVMRWFG